MLIILGAASFFVCLQYITTAVLQANGHERITLMTIPIGATLKVMLGYILVGNPDIGIIGSPIGTLACFAVISTMNIIFILTLIKDRPGISGAFLKPLMCAVVMSVAAYLAYEIVYRFGSGLIGTGRFAITAFLGVAVIVGVAVYGALIIVSKTVTMEDMRLVPKGEKLARIFRIK